MKLLTFIEKYESNHYHLKLNNTWMSLGENGIHRITQILWNQILL